VSDQITSPEVINRLKSKANPQNVAGMARFGIKPHNAYGISMPYLRTFAKEIGKNHELAAQLWTSGIHEARILASLIEKPVWVTESQMDSWVDDFDSWDICDQCCVNLFRYTNFAYDKAIQWSSSRDEFVKRAGFVLMAGLAVKDKKSPDSRFEQFFAIIKKESSDERNFVKKAVNWALRQIGKRNLDLNQKAILLSREIHEIDSPTARWIAADALRELNSQEIQTRLHQ
jgi:3-methyladenine DNA glycosylase AlkD